MSGHDVEIHLIAYDEASETIEEAGSNLSVTFTNIEGQTEDLVATTDDATSQISSDYQQVGDAGQSLADTQDTVQASTTQTAMGFNNLATSGMMLYMAVNNVENAQVSLDRAHLQVEKSTNAVAAAQLAYNDAVAKYGPNSAQAEAALTKLNTAQDALKVAQERADEAQRNYNNTLIFSALSVIPSLITAVTSLITIMPTLSGAIEGVGAVLEWLEMNPIVLVIAGIAALVAGLVYAYQNCAPFRNAINELGAVLGGAFATAVHAAGEALNWLWQNVLLPVAEYLIGTFLSDWNTMVNGLMSIWNAVAGPLVGAITAFINDVKAVFNFLFGWLVGGSLWKDLCDGLVTIWNDVVGPLVGIISDFVSTVETLFNDLASTLSGIWNGIVSGVKDAVNAISSAISTVSGAVSAVGGAVSGAANTVANGMGSVANSVGGALSSAGGAISNFIGSICFAHALENAANASTKTMAGWNSMIQDSMNKGLESIKNFGTQAGLTSGFGMGGASIGAAVPVAPTQHATTVSVQGPLVNIEGSADKATVDLATQQVLAQMKTIIVEPTSTGAPATQKRIRSGAVMT